MQTRTSLFLDTFLHLCQVSHLSPSFSSRAAAFISYRHFLQPVLILKLPSFHSPLRKPPRITNQQSRRSPGGRGPSSYTSASPRTSSRRSSERAPAKIWHRLMKFQLCTLDTVSNCDPVVRRKFRTAAFPTPRARLPSVGAGNARPSARAAGTAVAGEQLLLAPSCPSRSFRNSAPQRNVRAVQDAVLLFYRHASVASRDYIRPSCSSFSKTMLH